MVDLFSRVLKGGDFAAEAQKCSKSGKEIGCQLKHVSSQNKVALALIYSMLPSYSELKARVKDRFLEPGRMVCTFRVFYLFNIIQGLSIKYPCLKNHKNLITRPIFEFQ